MRSMPLRSQLLFFAGTFFVFLPTGLLTDVAKLGATPVGRLVLSCVIAGGTAVAYTAVARFGAGLDGGAGTDSTSSAWRRSSAGSDRSVRSWRERP